MPLHFLQLSVRTKRPFQKGLFTLTLYRCYILMYPSAPLSGPNSPLPYVRGTEQRLARPSRLSRPCAASVHGVSEGVPALPVVAVGTSQIRWLLSSLAACEFPDSLTLSMYGLYLVVCGLFQEEATGVRQIRWDIPKHTETMLDSLAMGLWGYSGAVLQTALDNLCPVGETFAFEGWTLTATCLLQPDVHALS